MAELGRIILFTMSKMETQTLTPSEADQVDQLIGDYNDTYTNCFCHMGDDKRVCIVPDLSELREYACQLNLNPKDIYFSSRNTDPVYPLSARKCINTA